MDNEFFEEVDEDVEFSDEDFISEEEIKTIFTVCW